MNMDKHERKKINLLIKNKRNVYYNLVKTEYYTHN